MQTTQSSITATAPTTAANKRERAQSLADGVEKMLRENEAAARKDQMPMLADFFKRLADDTYWAAPSNGM